MKKEIEIEKEIEKETKNAMTQESEKEIDPYLVLFPMGIVTAALGVLLWPALQSSMVSFFPREAHGNLLFFGFLWSFVAGFLMTAVPRMTQTRKAQLFEIGLALTFVVFQWMLNVRNFTSASVGLYAIQLLFLVGFIARRFFKRKKMPFEGFVFVPFALLAGFLGTAIFFFKAPLPMGWVYLLSGQALILNLLCGIGSRLIPLLSRLPEAQEADASGAHLRFLRMFVLAIVLNCTFLLEVLGQSHLGYLFRAMFLCCMAVFHFRMLTKPTVRTFVGWGLKIAVLFMILGYSLLAIFPEKQALPFLHLVYIGGFTLLTLMVATRVTLAHGGLGVEWELKSRIILAIVGGLSGAALLRLWVGSDLTHRGLTGAAFLFASLGIAWVWRFFRDSFVTK